MLRIAKERQLPSSRGACATKEQFEALCTDMVSTSYQYVLLFIYIMRNVFGNKKRKMGERDVNEQQQKKYVKIIRSPYCRTVTASAGKSRKSGEMRKKECRCKMKRQTRKMLGNIF